MDNVSGINKCGHRVHNFHDRSNQVMTGKVELTRRVRTGRARTGRDRTGPVKTCQWQLKNGSKRVTSGSPDP